MMVHGYWNHRMCLLAVILSLALMQGSCDVTPGEDDNSTLSMSTSSDNTTEESEIFTTEIILTTEEQTTPATAVPIDKPRAASQVLMSDEKRLTKYILENYERVGLNGRPTFNSSDAIDVAVTLSLVRINDVDTEHQVMDSLGWLAMEYTDVLCRWNPEDFGGVQKLAVPGNRIWTPDIVLLNAVAAPVPIHDMLATVSKDGRIRYTPYYHFRSLCEVTDDTAKKVDCDLVFGSWVRSKNYMAITASPRADAEFYRANPDFMLISSKSKTKDRTYKCCPEEEFSEVTYTISLERRKKDDSAGVEEANAAIRTGGAITALIAALALLTTSP